ncbi:hypothetical protein PVAG01_09836 [Phlyctema vagabunda]|uniref:Uncharacterized protein n=1 Tax=Phlyctema vagabunda TaxID=108571 RepID=A0ABR4P4A0_9HELO
MNPDLEADNESILLPSVTESLTTSHKERILNRIWGFELPTTSRVAKYKGFLEHYESQVTEEEHIDTIDAVIHTHGDILYFIDALKRNPQLSRSDLQKSLELSARCSTITSGSSLETLRHLRELDTARAIDSALATAVRIMYAVHLSTNSGRILVGQSATTWEASKSLETILQETFPTHDLADEPNSPIKANKLRLRYLETHVDVQVVWTRHLPDHLKLDIGPRQKVLRVFELASLLEMTYEVMSNEPYQLDLHHSLLKGCYAPEFLHETLRTIALLFPTQDRQWLERKINPRSRWFRIGRRESRQLDKRLSAPFKSHHGETLHDRPLTTRRELFARYPHWAVRLHTIYAEAEDPTPVSWFGKWAERRKAARHTFWLTFVGFMVAILFGILASILAAVQIWLSYCQWQGENASVVCRTPTQPVISGSP